MRLSFRLVIAWLVALSFACTDHGTGPATSTDATLALRPSFSTAGAAQATRAIHRIRLEARAEGTTDVLVRTVVDVDPAATSWSVPLDVPFVPGRRIVVTIELIHVAADGSESVEWSGVTAPIALAAGATTENGVTVYPGPLDNLQIRSLTLQEVPTEMVEGDFELLRAVVDAPAGLDVRVFWTSTNPEVMSVDNTGRVRALLPGTTRIIAEAGPFADTAVIAVRAQPRTIEVTPSSVLLEHIGAEALLSGRVLDARGDPVPGTTIEWSVSDAAVLQDLGGGSVRALAPGTATVTATSPQAPGLSGAATVDVVQQPAAIRVSPDVIVLNALGATAPLSAVVDDAGGTAIAGIAVDWSSADPAIATVSADGVVTAVGDGATTITAAAAGLSATVQLTVARTPARLTILAGDGQTAVVGAAVAVAPAVRVEDANGHPLAGIAVGFSVVAGGGTVAVASAVSDAAGAASAGGWTLGTAAGENLLTATASGVAALTFTATAVAGAPAAIAGVAGDGQTAPAGSAVPVAPAVRITDQHGNPVAGVTIAFTASGDGSITPSTVQTGQDGIASATSWQLGTVAGTYTAHAAADGVGSVMFTATAEAGPPAVLEMIAGDGQTAAAGTALPIAPAVAVADAHGNGVAGVTVTFTVSGGTITPATVVSDADGFASAASWQLGTVVGTYTAQASADGVASVAFTATAVAGAPGNIAIIAGNTQTAGVGTAVEVAPAVQVTDVHGNAAAGVTVTFAVGTGGGTVAPASVVTDAAGAAAVTSWTLGAEPGENTLTATVGELTVTFTATAEPVHGAPFAITPVDGLDQSALPGTSVAVAPAVTVKDEQGRAVPGVTVTFAVHQGGGSITGESAVTDVAGTARVGSWTLGPEPAVNVLSAAVDALEPVFVHATGTTGEPASVIIAAGNGQSAPAGTAVTIAPAVIVLDDLERVMPDVTATFAVASGGGSITGETAVTDGAGLAAVGSWTLGANAGENTLTATVTGLTAVVFTATAMDLCADAPALAVGGAQLTGEFSATGCVVDGVPTNFFTITLDAPTVFTVEVPTAVTGGIKLDFYEGTSFLRGMGTSAAPALFAIAAPAGTYRLRAQPLDGATVGTYGIVNRAGSTGCDHVSVVRPVTVAGSLADGDCVTEGVQDNYSPFVAVAPTTALRVSVSASAAVTLMAARTDGTIIASADGAAPVITFVPQNDLGHVAVRAPTAGATYSIGFEAVLPPTAIAIHEGDAQTADAASAVPVAPAVIVRNANAEPVQGVVVTFTVASGGGSVTGATAITGADGIARVGSWTLGEGANTLTAQAADVASTVTFTATGTPSTPVLSPSLGERTFVGVSFSAPLLVLLNQPAPAGGLTVTVTSSDETKLTIASPGTVTIPAGATEASITVNGVAAGTSTVTAAASGVTSGTLSVPVSLRLISLPSTLNVPFGGTASLPIQLAEPAPAGGTVVTLVSSDATRVAISAETVTVPAGALAANATLSGVYPGPATIQASATEYIGASSSATTRANLDITQSSVSFSVGFPTTTTVRFMSSGSAIAAPAGGVAVTVTSRNTACAVAPNVTIDAGLTSQSIPIDYGGTATTACTTWVVASAADVAPDSVQVTVNPPPVISIGSLTVASGLQRNRQSSSLGITTHGGVTVTLVSADPSRVLIAAAAHTAGVDTLRVSVPNGQSAIPFYIQAQDGVTGAVTVTASATNFVSGSMTVTVVTPGIEMHGLPTSTTTLTGRSHIYAQVGIPCSNGTSLCEVQNRRAGAAPIPVTFQLPDTTIAGRLVVSADSGTSVVSYVQPQLYYTPTSVAGGGAAFQPLLAGSATMTVTAPGFTTLTNATRSISITSPTISVGATTVASGLMRSRGSASLGAGAHGGVIVRVTSADPALFLVSPNTGTAGTAFIDVTLADGQTHIPFYVHGLEGVTGSAAVTVTAPGFSDGSATVTVVQPGVELHNVPSSTTSLTGDRVIYAQVGIPNSTHAYLQEVQNVRAGAAPLKIAFATPDSNVVRLITARGTADTASAVINPGIYHTPTSTAAGVTMQPNTAGSTTISVSAPGVIATTSATRAITVTTASISLSNTTVGAGLQRFRAGAALGANDHGGVTVTLVSSDSSRILLSPNAGTAGTGALQVAVANGATSIPFYAQGVENVTGTATITASASGFNSASATFSVVQPAIGVVNLPTSTTTLSPQNQFYAQVGVSNSSEQVVEVQNVRAGGTPIVVTFTSSTTAGQLVTSSTSGGTATVTIPVGLYYSPTAVTSGGVAFRPLTAGTTRVSGTAAGILSGTAFRDITVTAPAINMGATTVGAGLMRSRGGASLGASSHGGVYVRIRSSNGTVALVSPNASTAGTDSIDVFVASGATNIPFLVHGVDGATGTVSITASAAGFTDGTTTATVVTPGVDLQGLSTSMNLASNDDAGYVRVGVPCSNNAGLCEVQNRRAGQTALQATLTSTSPAVAPLITTSDTAGSVTVNINAGIYHSPTSVAGGGFAVRALGVGTSTVSAAIPGFTPMATASRSITVVNASVITSAATIGAGLQRLRPSSSLSGPNHGGVTVRITSTDPAKLLVSPNATTAGASFIDVFVAHGSPSFSYYVQGVEGATGSVAVTAEVPTWTSSTATWAVVQPAVELHGLPTSDAAGSAADPFYAQVGIPNAGLTSLQEVQNVRAGASPLTVTFTSSDGAVGQILANSVTATTGTAPIAAGIYHTPTSISGGGAGFVPLAAGTVNITATAPGFRAVTISTRTITVSN